MSADQKDLNFLRELLEKGKITPIIWQLFALEEVPEAIRQISRGHTQGKIVITI